MNGTSKNIIALYIVSCCGIAQATTTKNQPQGNLPIKVPHFIDGNPTPGFGISAMEISNLIYIAKSVEELNIGTLDRSTGSRKGAYPFKEKLCTIKELHEIEQKHTCANDEKQKLSELLEKAKHDLMTIAEPFIAQGRHVKSLTLEFLDQWAHNHNRHGSFLLHWSKQEDGKEIETFFKEVTSFGHLHDFCRDLVSFISDLITSCPKAVEQFHMLRKKQHDGK